MSDETIDTASTIEPSTTPVVVPKKTLNRNSGWVIVIDEPAKRVSVRWNQGYLDGEGKFVADRIRTYRFEDDGVSEGWSDLRKGVNIILKKPLAIVTPEGEEQTIPEGTKVKITEKMMVRAIVKALRKAGEV